MATRYDAALRRLESRVGVDLLKVHACLNPESLGRGGFGRGEAAPIRIENCAAGECECEKARVAHMVATRNRGRFLFLDYRSAQL